MENRLIYKNPEAKRGRSVTPAIEQAAETCPNITQQLAELKDSISPLQLVPGLTPEKIREAKRNLRSALAIIKKTYEDETLNFNIEFTDPKHYLPLMVKESKLDPDAVSSMGAQGYFQLMSGARKDVEELLGQSVDISPTSVKNCVIGIVYYHICMESYALMGPFKNLPAPDRRKIGLMMYNKGVGTVIKLYKKTEATSFTDFTTKLNTLLAQHLGVEELTEQEIGDTNFKVCYLEHSAIRKYKELLKKDPEKILRKGFKIKGESIAIRIGQVGEMLRYVRVITALEDLNKRKLPWQSTLLEKARILPRYLKDPDQDFEREGQEPLTNRFKFNPKKELISRPGGLKRSKKRSKTTAIVLHSMDTNTRKGFEEAMKTKRVHFFVDKKGRIYQSYNSAAKLNHAGRPGNKRKASWNGDENISYHSIGIEVEAFGGKENPKTGQMEGVEEWEGPQYTAVKRLVHWLGKKYDLKKRDVVAHRQVAYGKWGRGRKSDPYIKVDWDKLALSNNSNLLDLDVLAGTIDANMASIREEMGSKVGWYGMEESEIMALRLSDRLSSVAIMKEKGRQELKLGKVETPSKAKPKPKPRPQKRKPTQKEKLPKYITHTVRKGDALFRLAKYYGRKYKTKITSAAIKEANNLKGNLEVGQKLKIPIPR